MNDIIRNTVYRIGSTDTVGYFVRPWRGRAAILCYHRVLKKSNMDIEFSPLKNLAVSETYFIEQMKFLKKNYNIISMDQLINHLSSNSKEFVIAITFDDGYKDNYYHALPILDFYNIPATIFITTRFPEKECEMYWYELWELIKKKKIISFTNNNQLFSYNLKSPRKKINAFNSICNIIKMEDFNAQKEIMLKIRGNNKTLDYSNICLNWDEIIQISKSPNITIGSHGHSHLSFGTLKVNQIKSDLKHSKNLLENHIGIKINHFAYPFGETMDFNDNDKNLFNTLGFVSACLAFPYKIAYNTFNKYSLPRIPIRNEPINIFNAKISGLDNFFSVLRKRST